MTKEELKQLEIMAAKVRMGVIEGVHAAKSGHPGGSLSAADVITYLYFKEMNVRPEEPAWEDRDRFVLSKGHCAPALYAALAHRGFFPVEDLKTLRHVGSYLQGHPSIKDTPGVDMTTGSLGQGISAACGMALGLKFQGKKNRVFALLGDGEIEEGQVWEACMFAAHYKLDNLCIFIDNNNLQIDGPVNEVMSPYPIVDKLEAFGFKVVAINGNNMAEIAEACEQAKTVSGQPFAVVMKTTKGKGVSFMENQVGWHGKGPNDQEYEQAMAELTETLKGLEANE